MIGCLKPVGRLPVISFPVIKTAKMEMSIIKVNALGLFLPTNSDHLVFGIIIKKFYGTKCRIIFGIYPVQVTGGAIFLYSFLEMFLRSPVFLFVKEIHGSRYNADLHCHESLIFVR
jgi:hypothetical protein